MKKLKLIVSDFHLGRGKRLPNGAINPMEDFLYAHRFKEFLEYYMQPPYDDCETELIFDGDMLNLIQVDYHGHYPAVITEQVSMAKVKAVLDGHPVFFKAIKEFLVHPKRTLVYIIGNHDQEMMWKGARLLFEEAIGREVNWRNTYYVVDGVHVEHGHQFEAINRVDPTRPFLTENLPEPILNLPWGTLFTVHYLIRLKMSRPYIDKVRPFRNVIWTLLVHDTWIAIQHLFRLISFFISTQFSKSRYRHTNLRMTTKMLTEASVFPDLSDSARRILQTPEVHTVVFGHTHVFKQVQFGENKQYINTGTWTDIVSMELDSFGRRTKLTYVRVDYDEEGKPLTPLLRHWIGRIPLEDDALSL